MSYMYRNKKTREMITTSNRVRGKNWEPVEEEPPVEDIRKGEFIEDKPPVENIPEGEFAEDAASVEVPEEETAVVGAPAEKPKAPRRGKK